MDYLVWRTYTFGLDNFPSMLAMDDFPGSSMEIFENLEIFFERSQDTIKGVPSRNASKALELLPGIDGQLGVLGVQSIDMRRKAALIRKHYVLFSDLFADNRFENEAFMWWERLIGAQVDDGLAVRDDIMVCQALAEAASSILSLRSEVCQRSALHGLNEFGPLLPSSQFVRQIIQRFLHSNRPTSAIVRDYAWSVLSGNAQ